MRHIHALGLISCVFFALSAAACAGDPTGDGATRQLVTEGDKPDGTEGGTSDGSGCGTPDGNGGDKPDGDPSGGDTCISGMVGDGATCEDPGLLKDQANAVCLASGLQLVAFDYTGGACGWQTTLAKYACCPAPVDPPDPPAPLDCIDGGVGDGATCQSLADLKEQAILACEASNSQLFDIWASAHGCGDGEGTKVGFTCCSQ